MNSIGVQGKGESEDKWQTQVENDSSKKIIFLIQEMTYNIMFIFYLCLHLLTKINKSQLAMD